MAGSGAAPESRGLKRRQFLAGAGAGGLAPGIGVLGTGEWVQEASAAPHHPD